MLIDSHCHLNYPGLAERRDEVLANARAAGVGGFLNLSTKQREWGEVIAAAELLARDWNVASDVYSVTSFSELARDARETERWNRLHPAHPARESHVETRLEGLEPIVAATDYVRAYPQLIASYVAGRFVALGTDGFGRSDTRSALREFFEVDRNQIVIAALDALVQDGKLSRAVSIAALEKYDVPTGRAAPWNV